MNQCVFAPLNPALTVAEIEFELYDLPAAAMITLAGDSKAATVNECCRQHKVPVITMTASGSLLGRFTLTGKVVPTPPAITTTTPSDLALVLHTSGTTKKPKIVPLTHGNIGNGIQFVAQTLRRQPEHVCLNVMPLFHIHGLIANVGASIYSGAQVICSAFMGGSDFIQKLRDPLEVDKAGYPAPTW